MHLIAFLISLVVLLVSANSSYAQSTAFTYQGHLLENGNPANGSYDLRFEVFGAALGDSPIAGPITNKATAVTDGVFIVSMDFGSGIFTGADRWLEIGVRTAASVGDFTVLSPRQPITATPYAIRAREAGTATSVTGGVAASQILGPLSPTNFAAGSINSSMLAPGSVTTTNLADEAVTATKIFTSTAPVPVLTFTNPIPLKISASPDFGYAVAALGMDRVVISDIQSEKAYLFSTTGKLLSTFTNHHGGKFGATLAVVGTGQVLIGAPAGGGAAFLYDTNGTLLTSYGNPRASQAQSFGSSLAAVGNDRVIIGANGNNIDGTAGGAAYLFNTTGTLLTTFTNPAAATLGIFGAAVAAAGSDEVVITAMGRGPSNGAAYLFRANGQLLGTFKNPRAGDNLFGSAVVTSGSDRILIGAEGIPEIGAGAAYLFSTNGTLLSTFNNPNPAPGRNFGSALAAIGTDSVLIGAVRTLNIPPPANAVYLFSMTGDLIATITNAPTTNPELRFASDAFGSSVAAVGSDYALIGAPGNGEGIHGAAYLFRLERFIPDLVGDGALAGSIDTGSLAAGAVTPEKLSPVIGLWSASGSNIFRASGNVGIGTNNPTAPLHIKTDQDAEIALEVARGRTWMLKSTANSTPNLGGAFQIVDHTAGDKTRLMIRNDGNVGIGTTNPVAPLQVAGNFIWGGSQLRTDQGGSIELGYSADFGAPVPAGATPYIDFHYGIPFHIQDYNVRLINDANRQLTLIGNLAVTGAITPSSDRNVKQDFAPVNAGEVLEKVGRLSIQSWAYTNNAVVRHVGPVAQDFHAAFGLGEDDKHIATVDADGVAFLAIQGLKQKLEEKDREIEELRARMTELENIFKSPKPTAGGEGQ